METNQAENFRDIVLRLKGDKSYDAIEKLAGGAPTSRSLQKLVTKGFTRMPDPETFRGLALALNVSQRELVLAAARTLGIDIEAENPHNLVLVGAGKLPQPSQDLLISTSQQLQRWQQLTEERERELAEKNELLANQLNDAKGELYFARENDIPEKDRISSGQSKATQIELALAADKGEKNIDPEQLPED